MNLKNRSRFYKSSLIDEMHRFNVLLESREVFLHSYIESEEDCGIEFRMANTFIKNMVLLSRLDRQGPIVVHLHSQGGEWTEGMMIYDAIATCESPVIVITHGLAASMGSIIPQAADLRITMPSCWWLMHEGTTSIDGISWRKARSWANWEDTLDKEMMDIYAGVCEKGKIFEGKSLLSIKNTIKKHFEKKEDWLLSAKEAVDHGFADAVYGSEGYESFDQIKHHVF